MNDLANSMIQAVAGKAHERGLMDEAAARDHDAFVASVGKVRLKTKKSSNSLLPGKKKFELADVSSDLPSPVFERF